MNSKENNNNSYDKLYDIINSISEDLFEFSIYDEEILKNINEVNVCTDENINPFYCLVDENNKLNIPRNNLYSNEDNKIK